MPITLNGTTGIVAPSVTGTPVIGGLVSGTAVASTSGTSIDFTGIPSWAKRITVMFSGVSTSGTSNKLIQLGDSGGIEATGYLGASSSQAAASTSAANYTTGFGIVSNGAGDTFYGGITLSLLNASNNTWACFGVTARSDAAQTFNTAGTKSLSDTLTQVRITTVNGTDTFDAGTINIMYEG